MIELGRVKAPANGRIQSESVDVNSCLRSRLFCNGFSIQSPRPRRSLTFMDSRSSRKVPKELWYGKFIIQELAQFSLLVDLKKAGRSRYHRPPSHLRICSTYTVALIPNDRHAFHVRTRYFRARVRHRNKWCRWSLPLFKWKRILIRPGRRSCRAGRPVIRSRSVVSRTS
jgi:hypothetical protein